MAEDSFNQCALADITQSNLKRRSIVESTLSPLRPSLFTIFRDSTVKAFRHNSPWSIADRRDAFDQLLRTQRKPVMHNITALDNAGMLFNNDLFNATCWRRHVGDGMSESTCWR